MLNTPFNLGALQLPNRLIQGPLAGYSCAPLRRLVYQFMPPAYCVSEMISAHDLLLRDKKNSRYVYRSPEEQRLCYQISGHNPDVLMNAAIHLQALGADLIDLNCGCPKPKIRKQGAGSALLDNPHHLLELVARVRSRLQIPLTVKLRLQQTMDECEFAQRLEQAGADALIIHARHWTDDYSVPCNWSRVERIKRAVSIPVIANGDLANIQHITHVYERTGCDAFMLARAGCGQPWLYQSLLTGVPIAELTNGRQQKALFKQHLYALAALETEHSAILQSQSLIRYYFRQALSIAQLQPLRAMQQLSELDTVLANLSDD